MTSDEAKRARLFPALDPGQLTRLGACGRQRAVAAGEVLVEHGATPVPCFVVLEGRLEISMPNSGGEHVVEEVRRSEFTGEVGMLARRRSLTTIRSAEPSRVIEIPHEELRRLLATDSELGELFLRAYILRRAELLARGESDLVLVGSRHSAETLRLQEFLTRNGHPYVYLDVERDPEVQELLDRLHVGIADVPFVIGSGDQVIKRPTIAQIAACIGVSEVNQSRVHDLVVIGAGPAGLATAVYAASEGLDVVVLEAEAPGGQAGTSSKIENYLGFPTGISGRDLAARAGIQATKFGAELSVARTATALGCVDAPYRVEIGEVSVQTRAVVIASGARYRKLDVPELARFEGSGVYYAATEMEATMCQRDDVAVVGGGNSAGQAAVFLSRRSRKVTMLVRARGLAETMSRYLIQRIEETPNIELRTRIQIEALEGERAVERVRCVDLERGDRVTYPIAHVFVMTGADPATSWLDKCVVLDDKGFVKTGLDLDRDELVGAKWPLARDPLQFETSRPRVFAVGDVRAGSIKRVAAAVGEGSACVALVHRVLAE